MNRHPLPQSEVNRMLGTAEVTEIEDNYIPLLLTKPLRLRMVHSVAFSGTSEEVNPEKHKLKVMVKIFGRKPPLELKLLCKLKRN